MAVMGGIGSFRSCAGLSVALVMQLVGAISVALGTHTVTPRLSYTATWLGNTYGGGRCSAPMSREFNGECWIHSQSTSFAVAHDGTVFTNAAWDERHAESQVFTPKGKLAGAVDWQGFYPGAGAGVGLSKKYVFMLHGMYAKYEPFANGTAHLGTCWGITRWSASAATYPPYGNASWPGGGCPGIELLIRQSPGTNMLQLGQEPGTDTHPATGLTVCGDSRLFFVHGNASVIDKNHGTGPLPSVDPQLNHTLLEINPETMVIRRRVQHPSLSSAGPLSCGPPLSNSSAGAYILFMMRDCSGSNQGSAVTGCRRLSAISSVDGSTLFNISDVLQPRAITFDSASQTLFVADTHSSRQNIRIYEANGSYVGSFGAAGGVYAPGMAAGDMGPTRFVGVAGVGVDDDGCLTLNSAGPPRVGTDIRRFCPKTAVPAARPTSASEWVNALAEYELQWKLENLGGPMATAGVSAANESLVHRQRFTYEVDWSKAASAIDVNESTNAGFWRTKAVNFDFAKYPDDLRNHREWTEFLSDTTLSRSVDPAHTGSSTELIFQHTYGTYVFIYRTSGSIFVPCSMLGWTSTSARQYNPAAWPATRGAPNLQMWLWADQDGDGSMHASEFKDLTDNNVSATWRSMGLSVDAAGGIWHRAATGHNCINATTEVDTHGNSHSSCHEYAPLHDWLIHFPLTGIDTHGCPVYGTAEPGWEASAWVWPPAPFNETLKGPIRNISGHLERPMSGLADCPLGDPRAGGCFGRLEYQDESDQMWVVDFTNESPQGARDHGENIGQEAGSRVCRFDGFQQAGPHKPPSPALCFDLPVWSNATGHADPMANITHDFAVAGDCVFVAIMGGGLDLPETLVKTNNAGIIIVHSGKTGELLGYLNPDSHKYLGSSGWIDLPFGVTATKLSDGSVVVLAENDLYGNVITYVIDSGIC